MGYFGKTELEIDEHGPMSVEVFHPHNDNVRDPVLVALDLDGYYVFIVNGDLVGIEGKIALCLLVQRYPESSKFSRSEKEILDALVKREERGYL